MGGTNGGGPRTANLLETGRQMHNATALRAPPVVDPINRPTPAGSHVFQSAAIEAPAPAADAVEVVEYIVPAGFRAVLTHLLAVYVGGAWDQGDDSLLYFSLLLNNRAVRGFDLLPWQMGSLANGPYPIPWKVRLEPKDVVQLMVTVPVGSTIATGAPNYVIGHLVGGEWATGEE